MHKFNTNTNTNTDTRIKSLRIKANVKAGACSNPGAAIEAWDLMNYPNDFMDRQAAPPIRQR